MLEIKKHVMGGLRKMLDDRLASRLKPKAVEVEVTTMGKKGEGDEMPEAPEVGDVEKVEDPMGMGGDLSKLDPQEREELQRLYAKMGC